MLCYFSSYRYERHLVFPKLFSSKCSDYNNENTIFNADDRKLGTSRRYLCNRLNDNVNVYTLEVSMNGFFIKGTNIITPYTEADCKEEKIKIEISL
jgi:cytosolic carboxypeptidase protein 6